MLNGLELSCTPVSGPICQLPLAPNRLELRLTRRREHQSRFPKSQKPDQLRPVLVILRLQLPLFVFYSSPGIAEQLSQLCLPCVVVIVVVVGFFELLVSYYGNHNSHISDRLLAMRQCTQLNGKTIRKEFCCRRAQWGKVIGAINNAFFTFVNIKRTLFISCAKSQ